MAEPFEELRAFITDQVTEGFDSIHDIVENANEYAYETHGRDDWGPEIKRITAEIIAKHRSDQKEWESTTDCDRLDQAFAALNRNGIVARQDFSCCNTCGFTEIWDEIEDEEKRQPVEGFVFYHLQCTQQAIETGRLFMAYGSIVEEIEAFNRVANRIVAELNKVGLKASWQGTAGHPVIVEGIVWRRCR